MDLLAESTSMSDVSIIAVFGEELQKRIVGNDKIRIHDGVDQLHVDLLHAVKDSAEHGPAVGNSG